MFLKTYEVINLFTGKVDDILAYHMEDAMIRFLCDKFCVREQIRIHGLFSVASIGVLNPNHLIYGGCEWEFIMKG
jgi:hypothetical protein